MTRNAASHRRQEPNVPLIPDILVDKVATGYRVMLEDDYVPRIRISPVLEERLRNARTPAAEKKEFKRRIDGARRLIRNIKKRQQILIRVAEALVRHQREFFDSGLNHLKPLCLEQVAEDLSISRSLLSRVIRERTMQTPHGVVQMEAFFADRPA